MRIRTFRRTAPAALLALGLLGAACAGAAPRAEPAGAAKARAPVGPAAAPLLVAAAMPTLPAPVTTALAAPTPARPAVADPAARFDLSVNNAPAAQVFMQLGSGTAYNVLVAPEVSGNVSITLRDTTVVEALESLRELFGYDFRIAGNRIFVYPNTVQTKLYRVNYLPGRRQGSSDIRVTSSSISKAGNPGGGTAPATTGSPATPQGGGLLTRSDESSVVRTTSDADFWAEVKASLDMLLPREQGRSVVLNPASGVIVVRATPFELRQIDQYLKAIQLSIERQVMIEAKIIEVQLSNDAQTGINWGAFGRTLGDRVGVAVGSVAPGSTVGPKGSLTTADGTSVTVGGSSAAAIAASTLGRGFYGLALQASNFAALINFLQSQGDVSVLSSPRVATLNNQKAVLKVGTDELYVTGISTTTTTSGSGAVSTPTVNLQAFFSGIALDVTPQIDDAGNVMLHVHPSISTVAERSKNIDLGALGSYKLPLATSAINEIDSIVRVKDGQIVAIGGLMKQENRAEKSGVPGLQDVPVAGALFRQSSNASSKRELVVLLKPTVMRDDGTWPEPPAEPAPR